MDNNNIVNVFVEELNLDLLIIQYLEDDLEDILASLVRERGLLSKNFYEDFVIANCTANINQLLFAMGKINYMSENIKLSDLRRKIYDSVIDVNKSLDPKNVFVNKNGVLKLASTEKYELKAQEFWLVDNKLWNENNYEALLDKGEGVFATDEGDTEELSCDGCDNCGSDYKKISEMEYLVKEKWWKRLGQYIKIKSFNVADGPSILNASKFDTRTKFSAFIVSVCVVDVEEIYEYIDSLGTPKQVQPPILMHELYDLCRQVNPFLTYDKVPEKNKVSDGEGPKQSKRKSTASMSDYAKENKEAKLFKDVPKDELLYLGDNMKTSLIGQDKAIDDIVEAVQRASVGLKDPNKPIGSFLFAGPTGCGKTLTSKVLAENLIKDKDGLVIIDCSEYSAEHEYSKLIGAPAGYVGHEQGGFLTNAVAKNPFSVVVFDEVEKASHKIHELLLQVLDEGRLSDGLGNQVSFKNTVVIMTSNIGVKEVSSIASTIGFGDGNKITDDKKDVAIGSAIKKKFKPEFINRIDSIVYFRKLTKDNYIDIIDLELNKLNEYLKLNDTMYSGVSLLFDGKVRDYIYKEGVDEEYGARPLKRCIERAISTPLALKMLREDVSKNCEIMTTIKKNVPVFNIKVNEEEPKEERVACGAI